MASTRGESAGVWPWSLLAVAVLAQQVGSKAVRDGLFIGQASAAALPRVMLLGALLAVPAVLLTATAMARIGPRRLAAVLCLLSATLFALEWTWLARAPVVVAWLTYLHVSTLGTLTVSAFFSNVAEQFDPHSARSASSKVTSGAAVGGMLGGLGVAALANALSQSALLGLCALLNLVCAAGFVALRGRGARDTEAERGGLRHAYARLSRSRYLRSIASVLLLTGLCSVLLDYNFKAQAAEALGAGAPLLRLFAGFHTATSILTAIVQLLLARPALERLGLAGSLATLPASLLASGALGPFLPPLWSSALLRGAGSVLESSLFRSAYEPLYTPLSQRTRRSTKTLLDVAAGRLGDATGSALLMLLPLVWPGAQRVPVLLCALCAAALALYLSLRLHAGYVAELASSLRKGAVQLDANEVVDSTTRLTLSQTHVELERSQLLAQIAAQRASLPPPDQQPLLAAAAELLSGEPQRIKTLLARAPLDPRLASLVIPLLRHDALVEPVTQALVAIVDHIPGQLSDALLDPLQPLGVRRRLPRVLRRATHPRAALGLLEALRDGEPLVRYRAASALHALTASLPALAPSAERVFELALRELRALPPSATQITHVLTVLSLALDREALRLSRRALASRDARQRGTALEYLHSTVPEPLRAELASWLAARE